MTIERVVQFLASVYSPEFIRNQLSQQPNILTHMDNNAAFNHNTFPNSTALSIPYAGLAQPQTAAAAPTHAANDNSNNNNNWRTVSSSPSFDSQMQAESDLRLISNNSQLISAYSHPQIDYLKALADSSPSLGTPHLGGGSIPLGMKDVDLSSLHSLNSMVCVFNMRFAFFLLRSILRVLAAPLACRAFMELYVFDVSVACGTI